MSRSFCTGAWLSICYNLEGEQEGDCAEHRDSTDQSWFEVLDVYLPSLAEFTAYDVALHVKERHGDFPSNDGRTVLQPCP